MSTEPEQDTTEETTPEDFVRERALRRTSRVTLSAWREPVTEPKPSAKGLVTQGPRSGGYPRPYVSPDVMIRRSLRRGGDPWTSIL